MRVDPVEDVHRSEGWPHQRQLGIARFWGQLHRRHEAVAGTGTGRKVAAKDGLERKADDPVGTGLGAGSSLGSQD